MNSSKKIIAIVVVAVIAGLAGYYVYKYKGTLPSVPGGNYGQNSTSNSPATNSLIPEIFPSGKATLSWSANKEADLAGYKIYYGITPRAGTCPPGGYPKKVDIGNKTSYTIERLEIGKDYYFSITSYDKSGNESCFSAEVKKTIQK